MDFPSQTPENKDSESIFPGENWFFYWRASAALWEAKLAQIASGSVFIPLYWGFHTENAENYDFGEQKTEADLGRLFKAAQSMGKELVFLLPLTPVPFQPNGGLPSFLARGPSQDAQGLTHAFVDAQGSIQKTHSFYDPRVYQAFRKWVWQIGRFFAKASVSTEVRGLKAHWVEGGCAHSFLEDFSPAFHEGYVRFLKQQKLSVRTEGDKEISALPMAENVQQTARYRKLIADLYVQTASESLSEFWGGEQDYGFLGGAPENIFSRTSDRWPLREKHVEDLLTQMEWELVPSTVLLSSKTKKGVIERFLKDVVTPVFLQHQLSREVAEEADPGAFLPLVFFEFFWDEERRKQGLIHLDELGILPYLQRDYRGCWRWRHRFNLENDAENDSSTRLKFFFSRNMERERFQDVLRLFMNGHKIILDRSGLDPMLEKKLQLFITENDLRPQDVNFLTAITLVRLGDGLLVIYEGDKLLDVPIAKRAGFWEHLVKYSQLRHLTLRAETMPYFLWRTRPTGSYELNYDEVRRLSLYNPSESRQRCQIMGSKNFAFIKVVDPQAASARSTPMGVDVEMMPGGTISLDFGHFEG